MRASLAATLLVSVLALGCGLSLADAAARNDLSRVNTLLARGAGDDERMLAMVAAIEEGHTEVVKALLAAKIDPNATLGPPWNTPLVHLAASKHRPGVVKVLLAAGADPNKRSEGGETALMHVFYGPAHSELERLEVTDMLVAAKVDVNATNEKYENAIFLACYRGEPRAVQRLIEAGADAKLVAGYPCNVSLVPTYRSATGASWGPAQPRPWCTAYREGPGPEGVRFAILADYTNATHDQIAEFARKNIAPDAGDCIDLDDWKKCEEKVGRHPWRDEPRKYLTLKRGAPPASSTAVERAIEQVLEAPR